MTDSSLSKRPCLSVQDADKGIKPVLKSYPAELRSEYIEPEFGSVKFAKHLFGLSRTRLWELWSAGLIRTVVDKKPYNIRGKRLILLSSVREYFLKQESSINH